MRNVIYLFGNASFLACMAFTVATSITNPFYGMSASAVAQATTQTTTTGSDGSTTGGTVTYSINPKRFIVSDMDEYIVSDSKTTDTYEYEGYLNGGYKGILMGGVSVKRKTGVNTHSTSKIYKNATVCKDGGFSECYITPSLSTHFEW